MQEYISVPCFNYANVLSNINYANIFSDINYANILSDINYAIIYYQTLTML